MLISLFCDFYEPWGNKDMEKTVTSSQRGRISLWLEKRINEAWDFMKVEEAVWSMPPGLSSEKNNQVFLFPVLQC